MKEQMIEKNGEKTEHNSIYVSVASNNSTTEVIHDVLESIKCFLTGSDRLKKDKEDRSSNGPIMNTLRSTSSMLDDIVVLINEIGESIGFLDHESEAEHEECGCISGEDAATIVEKLNESCKENMNLKHNIEELYKELEKSKGKINEIKKAKAPVVKKPAQKKPVQKKVVKKVMKKAVAKSVKKKTRKK